MLLLELLLRRGLVRRNAEDDCSGALDFLECVAEPARINRSTWGVGFGIEEQHHVFAAIVLQRDRLAFFIGKRELGGFIINFHGFSVFITPMNLYRRTIFLASLSLLAVSSIAILAQRRATHKLRATALLEITTDSTGVVKSHVVPIAILDEGHFHDAGIYKATPRPMALADGVVYEAQQSGKAVGYVTITTGANQGGWIALGKWTLPSVAKKAEPQPAAPADERPVLHHGDSTPAASATPTPEQPSAGSAPPPQDPDRPVLRKAPEKAQPEQSAAATPTPTPGGAAS